ncbi:hypothetical protein SAMN04488026_108221 [Aliiruegeria lutimaris]|uniref:Transposase n=1 Tax=Aliiruegeria lutimaris TaxID=571298 RepID=A0A1G9JNL4_9RHOB|nr:hypothetical protein SAMN04488026_108221 [Aliiruegeria lutimaris]
MSQRGGSTLDATISSLAGGADHLGGAECVEVAHRHGDMGYVAALQNWANVWTTNRGREMARKRYSDEDVLKLLREIELKLADGDDVRTACRSVGVSDATYYNEP